MPKKGNPPLSSECSALTLIMAFSAQDRREQEDRGWARAVGSNLARTRRDFLRSAAGLTLGSTLARSSWAKALHATPKKKVVVVTFGGGARDQETFAPEGQENLRSE